MIPDTTTIQEGPVLLFDGVCNLCNTSVQWILKRDQKKQFRFASLQSDTGRALLAKVGFSEQKIETLVLVDGGRFFARSEAVLEIARRLGGIWSLAGVFRMIPLAMRDALYNWVARNRYRWFGKRAQCLLPRPEWKERFI